jgi:hypothetical protein
MHCIASGKDLVPEVFEGKWRGNNLPMWIFVLSEPCSTRLAHQGSFLLLSSEEALKAASHKSGRQENCPRGHKMIGRSFQKAFTRISSNRSPHKHGGMRRNPTWLLIDENKSYLACIGLPLASNHYQRFLCGSGAAIAKIAWTHVEKRQGDE